MFLNTSKLVSFEKSGLIITVLLDFTLSFLLKIKRCQSKWPRILISFSSFFTTAVNEHTKLCLKSVANTVGRRCFKHYELSQGQSHLIFFVSTYYKTENYNITVMNVIYNQPLQVTGPIDLNQLHLENIRLTGSIYVRNQVYFSISFCYV